jgi:CelD/BcsL family acetyltransferase involved in cellulose biosynthesis
LGERLDGLEVFFDQKARWFAAAGITNEFGDPRHRAFYRTMTALDDPAQGQLQIGRMRIGDNTIATLIGVIHRQRFTVLLSSITDEDTRRWSPGLLLMREQIRDLCRRGFYVYDLGVGENRNKSEWSDTDIPLMESHIGFGSLGKLMALPPTAWSALKRNIKSQPRLWALAQFVRRLLRGRTLQPATSTSD